MADQWTIRPLCFGEFPVFEKSVFTCMRHAGEKIRVPILGWLIATLSNASPRRDSWFRPRRCGRPWTRSRPSGIPTRSAFPH